MYDYVFWRENVLRYLRNSLGDRCCRSRALTVIIGAIGGYALSRLKSWLVDAALLIVLLYAGVPGRTAGDTDIHHFSRR